jgi:hypothetical protein
MVDRTPVNRDTEPIPIEAVVASAKILGEVPDKKPTSVESTIVGRATIVFRVENNASALVCHASPAHFSASFAIRASRAS